MQYLSKFKVWELNSVLPNPDVESVRQGVDICKENEINVVLAVGGGSVIDASKWIAVSACVEHDPWDFFCKKTIIDKALPLVTVVTMASTGSEMNNGGILSSRELVKKIGRSSPMMYPKASFLNPRYTYSVDSYQTASGIVDIISHIIEVYFSQQENIQFLIGIMESMVRTIIKYGKLVLKEPDNYEARSNLLLAASWAINGFINGSVKQRWNCHTIEHELSARYGITHGHGMAILLPKWLKYCYTNENKDIYYLCAKNMFSIECSDKADVLCKLVKAMEELFYCDFRLNSRLREFGVSFNDISEIAECICATGPIKGFTELDVEDIQTILQMCF